MNATEIEHQTPSDTTTFAANDWRVIGEQWGFLEVLDMLGSLTPAELAKVTGADEDLTHGWLSELAAHGRLKYLPQPQSFKLSGRH